MAGSFEDAGKFILFDMKCTLWYKVLFVYYFSDLFSVFPLMYPPDGCTVIQVSISVDGLPSGVDATIESENVTFVLYDVFFGGAPVSPSLKASVATGLATILK